MARIVIAVCTDVVRGIAHALTAGWGNDRWGIDPWGSV